MFIAMNANLRSRWLRRKLWPEPTEIFVKLTNGNTIAIKVSIFIRTDGLKVKLYEKEGYLPSNIRFIYAGKMLEDGRSLSLSDYNITDGSTILASLRLCGC
uniref:Ubiquitin-like domain-containing protein n=1 Tax=Cucumis sativus TaxID=3659 RepID=A0A0A0L2G3_CUCSA